MVSVIFCQLLTFSIWDRPKIYIGAYVKPGTIYVKSFQVVFKENYSSQLKTNYIYVFIFYIIVSYGYGSYQGPYIITLILILYAV
jgi:hypothetical protein